MSYRNELHGLDSNGDRDDGMDAFEQAGRIAAQNINIIGPSEEARINAYKRDDEMQEAADGAAQGITVTPGKIIHSHKVDGNHMPPRPQEIARWADSAMFRSEPMPTDAGATGPKVTLLNATPDPLGSLAALCAMYGGKVVRDLASVTDDERRFAYADVTKSKLQGPLEVVQFHFLVEGVTRAFTHQMVRERQAFFAQESLRFAVKEDWVKEIPAPPSIQQDSRQLIWERALDDAAAYYEELIEAGVPAEDARGLLPHAVTTRLHWVVDLRGLLYVAGLRLCTQAQFEWRHVMAGVVNALRQHGHGLYQSPNQDGDTESKADAWQFRLIADSMKPICYQEGKCGFKAKMDRPCSIRERVDGLERIGVDPSEWGTTMARQGNNMLRIRPSEWAADPTSARRQ